MIKRIVFATGNEGKVREVKQILGDLGVEVFSLKDLEISVDIEENGTTFLENALIKARAIHRMTGDLVLADDSGIEIDYFDKQPGVHSARFLGYDTPYEEKNAIILQRLDQVPEEKRTARYVCVIAAVLPDGRELDTYATIEGTIAYSPAGDGGFGYDPIFWLPDYQKTMAQISPEEKNVISHRGKALEAMKQKLAAAL